MIVTLDNIKCVHETTDANDKNRKSSDWSSITTYGTVENANFGTFFNLVRQAATDKSDEKRKTTNISKSCQGSYY